MNNKGFSLVELLAVIALMSVVIGIAVPLSNAMNDAINNYMLEQKIQMIEKNAEVYGEDNLDVIESETKKYNGYKCITISVKTLVPLYIDSETDFSNCLADNANPVSTNSGCIKDITEDDKYLDNNEIIVYYKNKKAHAKYVIDSNTDKCQ